MKPSYLSIYGALLLLVLSFATRLSGQGGCCNILTNGDFEQGGEFTSGLLLNCACGAGSYCVGTNLQVKCPQWDYLQDHTSGSGNFLIIDGDPSVPVDVWRKNTLVSANTTYCFSFWVASQYDSPFDLGLTVGGVLVPGAIFPVQQGTATWTQYTFSFSGISGNSIAIRQMTGGGERDFGLDDIEFGAPINASFVNNVNSSCGLTVSYINQSTGPAPLTYSWNFGDPSSPGNITSLPNPTHKFTDCGAYDVCLTVTRGNCVNTICETILVEDLVAPTAKCLNVSVVLDGNCMATVTPALIDGGSFDDCYLASMSVSPSVISGCGIHPVTLTVFDSCGNSSSCVSEVLAKETVPPIITCPASVSVNAIPNDCKIIVNGIKWLTASDNCGIPMVNYVATGATPTFGIKDISGWTFNQGVTSVTYTATDACGNTATCSFLVTVTCNAENCSCPLGGPAGSNLIANGNFSSGPSGFSSGLALNPFCAAGNYNVDTKFSNFCGSWDTLLDHTNDAQRKYLILDGADNGFLNKTILWSSNVSLTLNTTYCFSFWWASAYPNADANFDLDVFIEQGGFEYSLGPVTQIIQNTTVWTPASYTWISPLSGPATIHIRQASGDDHRDFGIDDICFRGENPPCDVSISVTQANDCTVQVTATTTGPQPVSYQWCDGHSGPSYTTQTFPCVPETYCVTATCSDGSTSTDLVVFTTTDIIPPVALCNLGVGVTLDNNCNYQVTPAFVDGGSSDNCGIKSLSVSPTVLTGCGTTTVTLTVTDYCDNFSTCTMGIQTIEVVPPTITCPPNVSANALAPACSIVVNGISFLSANDNCGFPTITHTINNGNPGSANASGTVFNTGTSLVTYLATDQCGNTATCSLTVTVTCLPESCSCPGSNAPSASLIANGDFSSGSAGFTSGLSGPSTGCGTGSYGVVPSFASYCSGWGPLVDHTNGSGLFLAVDGSNAIGNTSIWNSPVSLSSNSTYCFSFFWAIGFPHPSQNFNIRIDVVDGSGTVIQSGAGNIGIQNIANNVNWTAASFTWNSGTIPTVPLFIRISQVGGDIYRDFAIDDICFTKVMPPPACTCGTFSNMQYRPFVGAPNIPVDCGDSLVVDCGPVINWTLGGDFMCQGNSCPSTVSMFWNLYDPGSSLVTNGAMSGPAFNVSIPSSTFSAPGTYTLVLGAICGTDTCYCTYSVTSLCPPACACGGIVWAEFYRQWDWHKPITCGSNNAPPLKVPCAKPGQDYFIHGNFSCSMAGCDSNQVNWALTGPNSLAVNGAGFAYLTHFDISLSGAYFTVSGLYNLTVTWYCGGIPCSCTFKIEILPCACDCAHLQAQVQQGFSVSGGFLSCNRTFKPMANLCTNDQVRWHVNGPVVGITNGITPFSYTYPASGSYWVCMVVTRTDPVTNLLCTYKRCRWVKVKCTGHAVPSTCENPVVKNGEFLDGLVAGHLGETGSVQDWDWFPNSGQGAVYVDTFGSSDNGSLVFDGGQNNFAAVYQKIDIMQKSFINLEYQYVNLLGESLPSGTVIEFRLHVDSMPGSDSQVLDTYNVSSDTMSEGWQYRFISKPISGINPAYRYLIICVRNDDMQNRSLIGLDNLTICTSDTMLVGTEETAKIASLRIYPNPNTGNFNIELPEAAGSDMSFRIIGLTGQLIKAQQIETGTTLQTVQSTDLAAGLYFLQIVSEGKVLAVEKFVKQ